MYDINALLNHYGYIFLFTSLVLELIAFPLPGEVLMSYCGFLIFQGKLNWAMSILIAASGAITGITLSYFIGKNLGIKFFKRYGKYMHMGPERLERTSTWFEKYGNRLLLISYFIPGVRHITGYFSGITDISYRRFASNSYIGALIWTSTFISLGKILGNDWEKFHGTVKKYLIIGSLIIALIIIVIYLIRSYKAEIINSAINTLNFITKIFHSLEKIKIVVAIIAITFLGLSFTVIGLIQDYFANEFKEFDVIASLLIKLIFGPEYSNVMQYALRLTNYTVIVPLIVLLVIWIWINGTDKFLNIRFIIIVFLGGELIEEFLRHIFHRIGPVTNSLIGRANYTFPSEQTFISIVFYGFAVYLINRYSPSYLTKRLISFAAVIICIFAGISPIFFQNQYPSDVAAGYVFGGVWLCLNIVLLEIFRILPNL